MSFPQYSEYKDSGVEWFGKVPCGWRVQRLKQVVNPSRPITYGIVQAGENVPDGIPYIRPADMTEEVGVKAEDALLRTSQEIASAYRRSSILPGDIVCSIGPSFGKLMMVPPSLEGANLTQGTARVAVSHEHVPRFIFWVLRSVESYQQWESSVGGATFRALNLGPLAETFVCLPSRAEQTQIACFLDHEAACIDALIEEQQHLIELLKEKRQAAISRSVTKGLDTTMPMKHSGVEWLGEVPFGWRVQRLKHVVNPSRPITYGIVQAGENVPDGIPYIRPADMTEEVGVKAEDALLRTSQEIASAYRRSSILPGDIVCSIGPSFGKLMMVPPSLEGANLTQGTARVAVSNEHVPRFIFWVLRSVESYQQWESSVGGATFRALNLGPLAETFVCLPSRAEQTQIACFLDHETARIDELIEEAQKGVSLFQERRSALISAAVTGKIDVRGWQPPVSTQAPKLEVAEAD